MKDEILARQGLDITAERPERFSVGTVIDSPSQIQEDKQYTYFLFRVVIGKSYVKRQKSSSKDGQPTNSIQYPPEGYDSLYLESLSTPGG